MSTKDIEMAPEHARAMAVQAPAGALSAILADPEKLRDFPVEVVERMWSIHKDERDHDARLAFAQAFVRVQSRMTPVKKEGYNAQTRSTYAKAEHVERMLSPLLIEEGFSWSVSTSDGAPAGLVRFVLTLRHNQGHTEIHQMDAGVDSVGPKGQPVKTQLHGMGSSYTYCTKQLLSRVWGVIFCETDDDGNAGAGIGPSAERITEQQMLDLGALIDEVGADPARFRKFFKVESLADIPAGRFTEACRMLEAKRRQS